MKTSLKNLRQLIKEMYEEEIVFRAKVDGAEQNLTEALDNLFSAYSAPASPTFGPMY